MPRTVLNYIFVFILLVISQAVVFNNLVLFNSAVALVFIYLIIVLPITLSVNAVTSIAFALGLSVDIFQDTPGLNALACTVLGFCRRYIFHLYVPHDEDFSNKRLNINTLGSATYLKYMMTMVIFYCTEYFCIEAVNYPDFQRLFIRIIASSIYTFVVIYAIDSLTVTRREKRL